MKKHDKPVIMFFTVYLTSRLDGQFNVMAYLLYAVLQCPGLQYY
jgi:hypothetical protein